MMLLSTELVTSVQLRTARKNSNQLSSSVPVASVKLTFSNINEYEKDIFNINTKKNSKEKEGKKKQKKREKPFCK